MESHLRFYEVDASKRALAPPLQVSSLSLSLLSALDTGGSGSPSI